MGEFAGNLETRFEKLEDTSIMQGGELSDLSDQKSLNRSPHGLEL